MRSLRLLITALLTAAALALVAGPAHADEVVTAQNTDNGSVQAGTPDTVDPGQVTGPSPTYIIELPPCSSVPSNPSGPQVLCRPDPTPAPKPGPDPTAPPPSDPTMPSPRHDGTSPGGTHRSTASSSSGHPSVSSDPAQPAPTVPDQVALEGPDQDSSSDLASGFDPADPGARPTDGSEHNPLALIALIGILIAFALGGAAVWYRRHRDVEASGETF